MRLLPPRLLILLGAVALTAGCDRRAAEPGDALTGALEGRDLILVVADSLHAGHTSLHGYERPTTPFLDALAERGARAERALSQTSWTLSSMVSLFTGRVQESHGVLRADQPLPPDAPRTLAEMFRAKGYRTVGFTENGVVAPHTGLGRGFDRYEYIGFRGEHGDQELLRRAAAALAEEDERPLFLYLHLLPPHMPYQPPPPFAALFADEGNASAIEGTIGDVARIQVEQRTIDDPDVRRLVALYDAHIAYADDRVRQLVAARLEGEAAARTAVLVTSDHGEAFMQHGRTGHNTSVYQEMVHVPWVLAAPDALPGGVAIRGPVSLVDTLPTLAQLFELRMPPGPVDGVSLAGALDRDANPDGAAPDRGRGLYLSSRHSADESKIQYALVEGRWKFITRRRGQLPALFDIDADPLEQRDLAAEEPERAAGMAARLDERRASLARFVELRSQPLSEGIRKELEALGYAGEDFDEVVPGAGGGR